MSKKVFLLFFSLLLCCTLLSAQEAGKSELQQTAEAAATRGQVATARYTYIRAFDDYADRGQMEPSVRCGLKATALYYKENYWREAFELLRRIDQTIDAKAPAEGRAALHFLTAKERMQMYTKLHKSASAAEQLNHMENWARQANSPAVNDDLLFTKAAYYYTLGQNDKANAIFDEIAQKLTAEKEYDKVDEMFQTLIANGRSSSNANMVAQSYSHYIAWKDSVSALKTAEHIDSLKSQIATHEATIADKDSSLSSRSMVIVGLLVLAAILAALLVLGAIVLMRYMALSRKQKNNIKELKENSALKAKFISNISAQLTPSLKKLDSRIPEVKALLDFSDHVQVLSNLENTPSDSIEMQETDILPFCEKLMDGIRDKVKSDVTLKVNSPHMSAKIHPEYVSHIVSHLLANAAAFTPEGGTIVLDFKKRGAHTYQFLVSDTGVGIPEEKREDIFKPFLEIHDLTKGDGLGLPICKQMALKMGGDIDIDPQFTKGTRFVLHLHA